LGHSTAIGHLSIVLVLLNRTENCQEMLKNPLIASSLRLFPGLPDNDWQRVSFDCHPTNQKGPGSFRPLLYKIQFGVLTRSDDEAGVDGAGGLLGGGRLERVFAGGH
jgi:hypothetical protein